MGDLILIIPFLFDDDAYIDAITYDSTSFDSYL